MRPNHVKASLRRGETSVGTMVFEFKTKGIGRIASNAGAEFVIYDTEHTESTWETIATLLATSRAATAVPIVKVPAIERTSLSRPLDVGAMGLMMPMVESASQARDIVRWAKYPPQGERGAAFGLAHDDYAALDSRATMQSVNNETLLIAQIETLQGVRNLAEIAGVEGIDILWVGQADLTNSMGIPGQFDDMGYQKILDRVAQVAEESGKAAGFLVYSMDEAQRMIDRGYRCLAYSVDIWIYAAALKEGMDNIRLLVQQPPFGS